MSAQRYWIAVVSKEHTMRGVHGGFMQVCHGKPAPLKRIKKEDWIVVYSPKASLNNDEKCHAFTAIGQAMDDVVYQIKMSNDFIPFRRKVKFFDCRETSILPLIDKLDFIPNKNKWGYPFRFGFFEIKANDFDLIASNMLDHENRRQDIRG